MNKLFKNILILTFFMALSAILSIVFFKLPDWDFYSYHFYNGWAFLNDRINIDLMPCMFRTYFNPILDAITYIYLSRLNSYPLLFIILSGLKYGVLMFLAYKIYVFVLEKLENNDLITRIFCVITAGASPILLYCLCFDNTDIQIAILVLAGLYIYLKNIFKTDSNKKQIYIFIASFLMGMAFGLKYSCISSVLAIIFTTICLYKKIDNPFKTIFNMFFGFICGFIVVDGFWMWQLYTKFHNPLFPYFNNIFKSPFAQNSSVITSDFYHLLPKNIFDFIYYPLKNSLSNRFVGFENYYYDLKISLGFLSVILLCILFNKSDRIKAEDEVKNENLIHILILFSIFTYYINLLLFANIRYIITLLIVIPIIICFAMKIIVKKEYYYHGLIIIFLLFFATYSCNKLQMHKPWLSPKSIISIENLNFENNSVILCGNQSACFFAPMQNPNVKYVGFSLPQDIAERGYWNFIDVMKNQYFVNPYMEKVVKEILSKETNVYFAYSYVGLGEEKKDLKLYESALSLYAHKNITLDECKNLTYSSFLYKNSNNKSYICKIK